MVQLVHRGNRHASTEYCRVHDMVLELIRFLSSEENFVTILTKDTDHKPPSDTIRRLSLQSCKADQAGIQSNVNKEKIRSVVVFLPGNDPNLDLSSFGVLRVLDLEGCDLSNDHNLWCLGKLIQLRYLGLRDTYIRQLPEEIGNLRFLQTLDIRETAFDLNMLPSVIFQLKHLRCLHVNSCERVPHGIGNLTSLEVLTLGSVLYSTNIIELGHLTDLRVLKITLLDAHRTSGLAKSLAECLQKLKKLQSVDIGTLTSEGKSIGTLDAWLAPSSHLGKLELGYCWFSARPDWMDPSHLVHISSLCVQVMELQQKDLGILGRLPALRDMYLAVGHEKLGILRTLVMGACSFPSLVQCELWGFVPPVVFQQGAMPRLTDLEFTFPVRETRKIAGSIDAFELGLGNLTSLKNVTVTPWFTSLRRMEDSNRAMAVLMHAAKIHPNRLTVTLCAAGFDIFPGRRAIEFDTDSDDEFSSSEDGLPLPNSSSPRCHRRSLPSAPPAPSQVPARPAVEHEEDRMEDDGNRAIAVLRHAGKLHPNRPTVTQARAAGFDIFLGRGRTTELDTDSDDEFSSSKD